MALYELLAFETQFNSVKVLSLYLYTCVRDPRHVLTQSDPVIRLYGLWY